MFEDSQSHRLKKFGIIGTIIYLILVFLLLPTFYFLGWIKFEPLELNQIGDFLAGIFGPLAIFWLVLGFFQQGEELRNSVETLKLQATELSNSVEQQRELVAVTRDQLAHEREVIMKQSQQRKNRLQPKFIVDFHCSMGSGDLQEKYALNITNTGNAASKVSLNIVDQSTVAVSGEYRYVDRGWTTTIQAFSGNWLEKLERSLIFNIFYFDDDGDQWKLSGTIFPIETEKGIHSRFRFEEIGTAVL